MSVGIKVLDCEDDYLGRNVRLDANNKAVQGFQVGEDTLNVLAITASDVEQGTEELIRVCVDICKEINTTNHLAVWRRYLRTVWLHN